MNVGAIVALLCVVYWMIFQLRAAYHATGLEPLSELNLAPLANYPRLSIVIAASNEGHTLIESLPKLLDTDYPDVEFILVNDRSTDNTGQLFDEAASRDSRVKSIDISELPKGWLGKVNALKRGESVATGAFVLFTDADIHFEPHALERTVAYCETNSVDHMMLIPEARAPKGENLLGLLNISFGSLFLQKSRIRAINSDDPDAFGGIGAFNLVRRSVFERTEGFDWLRMEVVDDVGLGLLMKRHGAKARILSGNGLSHFEWYPTLPAMIKGLEKNTFGGVARYSYLRAFTIIAVMLMASCFPLVWAGYSGNLIPFAIALFFYSILPFLVALGMRSTVPFPPAVMLILPVGYALLAYAIFRSTYATWKQAGIYWRGTFYPLPELRLLQRVKL